MPSRLFLFRGAPVLLLALPCFAQGELLRVAGGSMIGGRGEYLEMATDLDGDGSPDLLVGDILFDTSSPQLGRVAAYSGATGMELWATLGPQNYARLGSGVTLIADVNGDGVRDVAAGATWVESPSGELNVGMVAILSGVDGGAIRTIYGGAVDDEIGTDVASVPDADGDGIDDLIAGSFPGVARVYSSATGAILRTTSAADSLERYSWCVERLSDLNGDGVDEYAIGAESQTSATPGYVDVHSGSDGSVLYRLYGDSGNDRFGDSVADLGDLDGDAISDLAIGAPWADHPSLSAGSVWIYSGASGALIDRVDGLGGGQLLGVSVARVGDLNGDGVSEFIAGAPNAGLYGQFRGLAIVYDGATRGRRFLLTNPSSGDDFGWSVAGGQDVNGDGLADMFVGVPDGIPTGEAFVFSGSTDGSPGGYCVGKVNSQGCTPVMSATGTPSIQGGDDLTVHANDVIRGSLGFYFWGLAPDLRLSIFGTICVGSGIARTPVIAVTDTGTGACDGDLAFRFDSSYFQFFGVQPGTRAHVQGWYRDVMAADGTGAGLTPGFAFTVCP